MNKKPHISIFVFLVAFFVLPYTLAAEEAQTTPQQTTSWVKTEEVGTGLGKYEGAWVYINIYDSNAQAYSLPVWVSKESLLSSAKNSPGKFFQFQSFDGGMILLNPSLQNVPIYYDSKQ